MVGTRSRAIRGSTCDGSTSGAAPPMVYAFRRVRRRTLTDAFHRCNAGRAGGCIHHRWRYAGHEPSDVLPRDRAGARPLSHGGTIAQRLLFKTSGSN